MFLSRLKARTIASRTTTLILISPYGSNDLPHSLYSFVRTTIIVLKMSLLQNQTLDDLPPATFVTKM